MSYQPQRRLTWTENGHDHHAEDRPSGQASTVSLVGLLAAVWERKLLFSIPVIICLIIGALYVLFTPAKFESTAKLLVQNKGVPLDQTEGAVRREDEFLATQAQVIASYEVVADAVKTLDLPPSENPGGDNVIAIRDSIAVVPLKDTDVVSVSYRGTNGEEAKRVMDALVASYRSFLKQDDNDAYQEALKILTESEKDLRAEMAVKKAELMKLHDEGPLLGQGKDPAEVQKTMLTSLGRAVVEAKDRRIQLSNQVNAFKSADPQVAEELVKMQNRSALQGGDTQGKDPVGIQMTLLIDLGEAKIDAINRRVELEKQIKAFKVTAAIETDDRISPAALEAIRQTRKRDANGKPKSGTTNPLATKGARPAKTRGGQFSLVGTEEPSLVRQALFEAQTRRTELAQKYGDKHPLMLAVNEQIKEWEARLAETTTAAFDNLQEEYDVVIHHMEKELEAAKGQEQNLTELYDVEFVKAKTAVVSHLQKELAAATQQEQELTALYQKEFQEAKVVDGFVLQEEQLRDDISRAHTVHESLLTQLKQWQLSAQSVAGGHSQVKVTVLQHPMTPMKAAWPIPWLVLAVCGIIGSMGGVGLVALAEGSGTTEAPRTTNALASAQASLPVVAEIPAVADKRPLQSGNPEMEHLVYDSPDSHISEAFRGLRARLDASRKAGRGLAIHVVSPTDDEGRTDVTPNLAQSFAQLGRTVAVVDADLRNGDIHDVFGIPNAGGLSTVLINETTLRESLVKSPHGEIAVLPRGPVVDNPAEFLSESGFEDVLTELRRHYDVVLINSSALLADFEANVVASVSDCVLLNTVVGRSSQADVERAGQLLDSLGVSNAGVVVSAEASADTGQHERPRITGKSNGMG